MDRSRFTNSMGGYLTRALFFETTLADKSTVLYTLKDRDHEGYPSLYLLYMACGDLTEHSFATSCLDGWAHWEALSEALWFKPYITRWRRELELQTRAKALRAIQEIGASPDSVNYYQANRFLVQAGWKPPAEKRRVGAPSKDEVRQEAQRLAQHEQSLLDDFARVTEKVN